MTYNPRKSGETDFRVTSDDLFVKYNTPVKLNVPQNDTKYRSCNSYRDDNQSILSQTILVKPDKQKPVQRRPNSAKVVSQSYDRKRKSIEIKPYSNNYQGAVKRKSLKANQGKLEQKQIKQIAILYAYNPSKLKNVTIKKKGLANLFDNYTSSTNSLNYNLIYFQPAIYCMNECKKDAKRKYRQYFNSFISEIQVSQIEVLLSNLKSMKNFCLENLERAEIILKSTENQKFRLLCHQFKSLVQKSQQFNSSLTLLCQGKKRIFQMIRIFSQSKDLKIMLKQFNTQKQTQLEHIFQNHHNTKTYEESIIQNVGKAMNSIVQDNKKVCDTMYDIKQIVDKVSSLSTQNKKVSYKALLKMNKIFTEILNQIKLFKSKMSHFNKDDELSMELKPKIMKYQVQLNEKKNLILQIMLQTMKSILQTIINKFIQNFSINRAVDQKRLKFTSLEQVMNVLIKTLIKQQILPQGQVLGNFFQSSSSILSDLKTEHSKLYEIRNDIKKSLVQCHNINELKPIKIKTLLEIGINYKTHLSTVIYNFQKVKLQLFQIQTYELNPLNIHDKQIDYIKNLMKKLNSTKIDQNRFQTLQTILNKQTNIQKCKELIKSNIDQLRQQKQIIINLKKQLTPNMIENIIGPLHLFEQYLTQINRVLKVADELQKLNKQNAIKMSQNIINLMKQLQQSSDSKNCIMKYLQLYLSQIIGAQKIKLYLLENQLKQQPQTNANNSQKHKRKEIEDCQLLFKDIQTAYNMKQLDIEQYFDQIKMNLEDIKIKQVLSSNNNQYYPNVNFIESISKTIFSSFVQYQVSSQCQQLEFVQQIQTLNNMIQNINKIKQNRVDSIKKKGNQLFELVNNISTSLRSYVQISQNNQQGKYYKYSQFIKNSIALFDYTNQLYFCLLNQHQSAILICNLKNQKNQQRVNEIFNKYQISLNEQSISIFRKNLKQVPNPFKKQRQTQILGKSKPVSASTNKKTVSQITNHHKEHSNSNSGQIDQEVIEDNVQEIQDEIEDNVQEIQDQIEYDMGQQISDDIEIGELLQFQNVQLKQQNISNLKQQNESKKSQGKSVETFGIKSSTFVMMQNVPSLKNLISSIDNYQKSKQKIQFNETIKQHLVTISACIIFGSNNVNKLPQQIDSFKIHISKIKQLIIENENNNCFKQIMNLDDDIIIIKKTLTKIQQILNNNKNELNIKVFQQLNELLFKITKQQQSIYSIIHKNTTILKIPSSSQQQVLVEYLKTPIHQIFNTDDIQIKYDEMSSYFYKNKSQSVYQLINTQQLSITNNIQFRIQLSSHQDQKLQINEQFLLQLFIKLLQYCYGNNNLQYNKQSIQNIVNKITKNMNQKYNNHENEMNSKYNRLIFKYLENDQEYKLYLQKKKNMVEEFISVLEEKINKIDSNINIREIDIKNIQQSILNNNSLDSQQSQRIKNKIDIYIQNHKRQQKQKQQQQKIRNQKLMIEQKRRYQKQIQEERIRKQNEMTKIKEQKQQQQRRRKQRQQERRRKQQQAQLIERQKIQKRQLEISSQREKQKQMQIYNQKVSEIEEEIYLKMYNQEYSQTCQNQQRNLSVVLSEGFQQENFKIKQYNILDFAPLQEINLNPKTRSRKLSTYFT